jgi:hypothetical protein
MEIYAWNEIKPAGCKYTYLIYSRILMMPMDAVFPFHQDPSSENGSGEPSGSFLRNNIT